MDITQLRHLQHEGVHDTISALRSVEINPIEICNRHCSFCPRSDPTVYPNRNLKASAELVQKVADDLEAFGFDGRLGFVGFGEPTLHKELSSLISIARTTITNLTWLEVNTNGDFLDAKMVRDLVTSGCNTLTISMYDKDESEKFRSLINSLPVKLTLRHHYNQSNNFGLSIVNRLDMINKNAEKLNIDRPCYYPFYKLIIDWNGDVLVCCEDWGRHSNLGNVFKQSIKDIWLGDKINEYRQHLIKGDRLKNKPCNTCNIDGTKFGKESAEVFQRDVYANSAII